MKTKLNKIMIALQAVSALCLIGAVKIWAPVCGKLLDLANGNQVPMKCHWAEQAAVLSITRKNWLRSAITLLSSLLFIRFWWKRA